MRLTAVMGKMALQRGSSDKGATIGGGVQRKKKIDAKKFVVLHSERKRDRGKAPSRSPFWVGRKERKTSEEGGLRKEEEEFGG